ncbi:MAG: sulfotransferase [Bacteroidota bacterium]
MNTEQIINKTQQGSSIATPLVFHIGWMRTGTTFLQGIFKREENIQLSLKNRFFSHDPYYLLGKEHYDELISGDGQQKVAVDSDENYAMGRFKTHLREENPQRTYNYKAELSFIHHDIPEMISRMKDMAPNAKIFGVVRKQSDWFESVYKHDVYHFGLDKTFKEFYESNLGQAYRRAADYSQVITLFQEAFGKENIKILLFEDFIHNQPQFIQSLSEFLGVDIQVGEKKNLKKNASTSGLFTHLHRMANKFGETDPKKPERKAYKTLRDLIYRLDSIATRREWQLPGQVISDKMQKRILNEFAESNRKLVEVIGSDTFLEEYRYI